MDPNMMNQNNQSGGMQQPQMMNQQDQNQNQVLNYDDVNNVAQKEKKSTSVKKIAIFIAIIGVILLGGGVMYTLNPIDEETPAPTPSDTKAIEETTTPEETETPSVITTCTLEDKAGTDGVTRSTVYTLSYDSNNTLASYTKDYTVTPVENNTAGQTKLTEEQTTLNTIATTLTTAPINGYSLIVTPPADATTALTVKLVVDFSILDATTIPETINANAVTKVDLAKGQTPDVINQTLTGFGYTCQ